MIIPTINIKFRLTAVVAKNKSKALIFFNRGLILLFLVKCVMKAILCPIY